MDAASIVGAVAMDQGRGRTSPSRCPRRPGACAWCRAAFVRHVHREGQVLQVWVVNDRADINRLLDWGVDGIISDRPDIAVATRDEWLVRRSSSEGGLRSRP